MSDTTRKLKKNINAYELEDGTTGEVRIRNQALVQWDKTRVMRKWPSVQDAPFLYNTFVTWYSLVLEKRYNGKFEDFEAAVIEVEPVDDDEAEAEADPT